jgi:putative transposase
MAELRRRYDVSRKTGYKWLGRFEEEGVAGLADRSRRPHFCPHETMPCVVEAILEARRHHPTWGAKKLLWWLERTHSDWPAPARRTVCDIVDRAGLVPAKRRRARPGHPGKPTRTSTAPNELWSADFKGQFKTRDGVYCYPLTVTDHFSRYLIGCQALLGPTHVSSKRVFERLFREFGMPLAIRTDNGVPFASEAIARLSRLSAWWIRLGIFPELIEPASPYQNGRHERMHRTLKAETTIPPAGDLRAQQRRFNAFRPEYNEERPHEALGLKTPASIHTVSPRLFPEKLPPLEYPSHFEVRRISNAGSIRWKGAPVNLSNILCTEYVGLEEVDNSIWAVHFGPIEIGRLDERIMRIVDSRGHAMRKSRPAK